MGEKKKEQLVFDAAGCVAGRVASRAMKEALSGKNVVILNAESAIISGSPVLLKATFLARRAVQQKANPDHSPVWPRRADLLFKKIIAGMAPKKKARGGNAIKAIMVHLGVPKEFEGAKAEKYAEKLSFKRVKATTLGQLCVLLGRPAQASA
ncbi:50S ribosomal protein L13 [Candidatus Micrarchaeota archaeon]|nr:50S ribosomal protein L13 [Candidatus Micrarchaeota archaeon]MBI5177383.1 50S ribosomal protein L13 [Candidatus Micrarchaeota archaeon]